MSNNTITLISLILNVILVITIMVGMSYILPKTAKDFFNIGVHASIEDVINYKLLMSGDKDAEIILRETIKLLEANLIEE